MARRRRSRRRSKKRLSLALWCVLLAFGGVLGINGAVRRLGGEVDWLSVRYLRERALAVALLCKHNAWLALGAGQGEAEPRAAIRQAAIRHGISTRLLLGVARAESDCVPSRISGTGAMGLMQLMPGTAKELDVGDPFDAVQNADGGARYLKYLLSVYRGNLRRALAAYNAGPGRIPVTGPAALPEETRNYVARITAEL